MHEWLEEWQKAANPSDKDFRLAQEIAFGTMRMKLALDDIAKQLEPSLKVKPKIQALLRTAIYQATMMDKIPQYAIVNETVQLAKKHFSLATANFLNALLRKLETVNLKTPQDLSVKYSYPSKLVDLFLQQFGKKSTAEILHLGNLPPKLMARELHSLRFEEILDLKKYVSSPHFYIQNKTPAHLFSYLKQNSSIMPQRILDLCSAPGGKLLLAHELFPEATLFANDVSEKKLRLLKENLKKYHISANLTCGAGEKFAADELFDLIILDVPCSNTGVLNKRPEARWRIDSLPNLQEQSKQLLAHAASLLKPNGSIWYMTCSILEEENEDFLHEVSEQLSLRISSSKLILPDNEGADGGFAAELTLV